MNMDTFMESLPGNPFSLDGLLKTTDINHEVQSHLRKVFILLMLTTLSAAAGSMFAMEIMHIPHFLAFFASLAIITALQRDPYKNMPERQSQRAGLLLGFGFLQGLAISDLIEVTLHIDPSIVFVASFATSLIFLSFAGAALLSERRSYFYLGGMLSSALSIMFWMSIANMFFGSITIFNLQLYGGLAVMIGFVMFDTQMIIERASIMKDYDAAGHAMSLFVDVLGIFVRVLVILLRQNVRQQEERKRQRRR